MGVAAAQPDPRQHLNEMLDLVEVLRSIGVTVQYVEMSDEILGELNDYTRTVYIRKNAHPLNQAWQLGQFLNLLLCGPAATPAARHERRLVLVPPLPSDL
jgi:uncharacterized protein involved in propanediol utilization